MLRVVADVEVEVAVGGRRGQGRGVGGHQPCQPAIEDGLEPDEAGDVTDNPRAGDDADNDGNDVFGGNDFEDALGVLIQQYLDAPECGANSCCAPSNPSLRRRTANPSC